ncbi:MAG TPA: hypothetical protein VHG28_21175 [Longimicrobiaceae bacterium]|nr:hypothetical protein [Longimicrobiaceae bacterium]
MGGRPQPHARGQERAYGTASQVPAARDLEASLSESRGAEQILPHLKALYPDLNVVWVDGAYATNTAGEAAEAAGIRLKVIPKEPGQNTLEALPRRRGVERTFPVADEVPAPARRLREHGEFLTPLDPARHDQPHGSSPPARVTLT